MGIMNPTLRIQPFGAHAKPVFAMLAVFTVSMGALASGRAPDVPTVSTAVTIDILLVIPLLYYFLVVRSARAPVITLLPVFRLCMAAAGSVLPADERGLYEMLAPAARLAELGMATFVAYRLHLGVRAFRSADIRDVLQRLTLAVRSALPNTVPSIDRAAGAIAFEAALVWYAHRGWRMRPDVPARALAFPGHRKSGYTGFIIGLVMIIGIEMLAVHILVAPWSVVAAWVLTGLTAYSLVWIVGDFHAVRLRPSWVDDDRVCLRLGVRWAVTIPKSQIAGVRRLGNNEPITGALRLALPNAPRVLIELKTPAIATGAYGMQREITSIEVGTDRPDQLAKAIVPESS
jgi:hypothetical protein